MMEDVRVVIRVEFWAIIEDCCLMMAERAGSIDVCEGDGGGGVD